MKEKEIEEILKSKDALAASLEIKQVIRKKLEFKSSIRFFAIAIVLAIVLLSLGLIYKYLLAISLIIFVISFLALLRGVVWSQITSKKVLVASINQVVEIRTKLQKDIKEQKKDNKRKENLIKIENILFLLLLEGER